MTSIVNAIREWKDLADSEIYREENKIYFAMIRTAFRDTGICNQHALKDLTDIQLLDIYVRLSRRAEKALLNMSENIYLLGDDI